MAFFVYSLVGILCFFIPFTINGNNTIFVDHVHLAIRSIIGPLMPYVALIMILIGTALPIVRRVHFYDFNAFKIGSLHYLKCLKFASLYRCNYRLFKIGFISNYVPVVLAFCRQLFLRIIDY